MLRDIETDLTNFPHGRLPSFVAYFDSHTMAPSCWEREPSTSSGQVVPYDRFWLQAAVRATSLVRPLYPREPTFERQRPLSWRGGPLYLGQPTPLGEVCQDRL